jgi:outer membrane protein TolC
MPVPVDTTEKDDTDWSITLNATLNLYNGGAKSAAVSKAREELSRLRILRQSTAEKIAENIRNALFQAATSHTSIQLSRDAAKAADKNLKLATDAYARGAVSIINLLDAQNASLVANQLAANSVYDFLIDLMRVQRATARFDFFTTPGEKKRWFEKIVNYFENNK